jgi:hypothetical protein
VLVRKTLLVEAIIKYEDNTDLKTETDDLNGNSLKSYAILKKMALKMDFVYESYALLIKSINGNQMTTW